MRSFSMIGRVAAVAALLALSFLIHDGISRPAEVRAGSVILSIDADTTGGACLTVDAAVAVDVGDTYTVGICVEGTGGVAPNAFTAVVEYDGVLNSAATISCTGACLDANPNANDGSTVGSTLGTGWDCTGFGVSLPVGDDPGTIGVADASITCNASIGSPVLNLTNDPGLLATITFTASSGGVEVLTVSAASNLNGDNCGAGLSCVGASITKTGATANTPTSTNTPAATSTPCGGGSSGPTCTPLPGQVKTVTPTPSGTPVDTPVPPGEGEPPPPTGPGGGTGPGGATPGTGVVGPDTGSGGYLPGAASDAGLSPWWLASMTVSLAVALSVSAWRGLTGATRSRDA
ncbi:MAG: hypothetical protein WEC75_08930 [Dehalococcoidia bacterium]